MNNSSTPEAAESAASDAAFPNSSTPAPGAQETPASPVTDLQIASADGTAKPTLVDAKPIAPRERMPALPRSIGLAERQRIALQALTMGKSIEEAAQITGVNPCTVYRWRKYDPAFIAAFNAWQAHSQQAARDCLAAATEHAARVVLHAIQKGDVRAALEVLKGSGMLKRQIPGPEFTKIVGNNLTVEANKAKAFLGGKTSDQKREAKRKAECKAEETRRWNKYFDYYSKTPPLARPITYPAIDQWIASHWATIATYQRLCSFTITAAAGDPKPLAKAIALYEQSSIEAVLTRLKTLPVLLSQLTLSNHSDELARKLEALGATVELRPSWVK